MDDKSSVEELFAAGTSVAKSDCRTLATINDASRMFYSFVSENVGEVARTAAKMTDDRNEVARVTEQVTVLLEKALLVEAIVERLDEYVKALALDLTGKE